MPVRNSFKITLTLALVLVATVAMAGQKQNLFLTQDSVDPYQNSFIRSDTSGLFMGTKAFGNISDYLSFELIHLKTMRKELDLSHRDTLERNTVIDLNFAKHLFSRIQLANTRQDAFVALDNSLFVSDDQNMYALSEGWKGTWGDLITESYIGVVRCADSDAQKYYPVFGMKIGKEFIDKAELQLSLAQEVQSGGSFTGIYGNQVFRRLMVNGKIALMNKLSLLWDAGIGLSQTSYEEKGTASGVATVSAALEYQIGTHVKGSMGYSHRKLVNLDTGLENAQGHMMSAELAIANF